MNVFVQLALAVGVALLLGRLIRYVHMPNVTAYLVAGLLAGPCVFGLISTEGLNSLSFLTELALGFIAYSIGGEFKLSFLKQIGKAPYIVTLFEGLTATALVDIVLIAIGTPVPEALMFGAIAAATAPAATLMVVRQYKAKGPVTSILLPVVAMDDALGLMLFAVSTAIAKGMLGGTVTVYSMLLKPVLEILESLLLGAALGFALTFVTRFFHSRANMLTLSIAFVLLAVGLSSMWGLSSLLVCMMLGAVMINCCNKADKLVEQCDRFTAPLFLMFFMLSGANLDLSILPSVGLIGVLYLVVRAIGKWSGASIGAIIAKQSPTVKKYMGLTLIPQAGVAIGMAQMSKTMMPEYADVINTVILSATLVYELTGPIITKLALQRAGEIAMEKA